MQISADILTINHDKLMKLVEMRINDTLLEWVVHELANARKIYQRMVGELNRALNNAYWQSQGLMGLVNRKLVRLGEPPYTEQYVRWCEGTEVNPPSYSILGINRILN